MLKNVVSIGVDNELSSFERKKVKVLNFCSLFLGFTVVFFTLLDFFQGILTVPIAINFSIQIVLLATIFYFHHKKYRVLARIIFLILVVTVLFIQNNILFKGFYGEYLYIVLPLLFLFFFNQKYVSYIILLVSLLLFYVPNVILKIYPDQYFGYANVVFLFVGVFSVVNFFKIQNQNNETELKKMNYKLGTAYKALQINKDNELDAAKLKVIRAQMNPHFIFNVINSIQNLILSDDKIQSYESLVQFSILVRNTLDYSEREYILLSEELSFLKNYLGLEQLRFSSDFNYVVDNKVKKNLLVPSLIIQPFVENSVKHGLFHKEGEKEVIVCCEVENDSLKCTITDNGIGIEKSRKIYERQELIVESFSTNAIKERLSIIAKKTNQKCFYQTHNLLDNNKNVVGTEVVMYLPLLFKI